MESHENWYHPLDSESFLTKTGRGIKRYSPTLVAGALVGGVFGVLGIGGANLQQTLNPEIFEFIKNNPETYRPLLNHPSAAIWVLSHPIEWVGGWSTGVAVWFSLMKKYI